MGQLRLRFDEMPPAAGQTEEGRTLDQMRACALTWTAVHSDLLGAVDAQEFDRVQTILSDKVTPVGERMVALAGPYTASLDADLAAAQDGARRRQQGSEWLVELLALMAVACSGSVFLLVRRAGIGLLEISAEMREKAEQVARWALHVRNAAGSPGWSGERTGRVVGGDLGHRFYQLKCMEILINLLIQRPH